MTKKSDEYDGKYMKMVWLNDDLPLNKVIEIHIATIVVGLSFLKIINIFHKFS